MIHVRLLFNFVKLSNVLFLNINYVLLEKCSNVFRKSTAVRLH